MPVEPSVLDQVVDWVARLGGFAGLALLIGAAVYIAQNRRKLDSESDKNAADSQKSKSSAKLDQANALDTIEKISVRLAEEYEKRYEDFRKEAKQELDSLDTKYKELVLKSQQDQLIIMKLTGKMARIVQLIKLNVEYRSAVPIEEPLRSRLDESDKTMLGKLQLIIDENGMHS